jgi:3-hydroxybutyryl-CoA dehydratase
MTVFAEDIEIGQSASYSRTVTERDIELFGEATGDMNPVHFDESYAATTPFKTRIAHGMLTAGFFSTVLGTKLPGAGSIYVSQTLSFKAPVRIGDTVEAVCTVTAKEKRRVTLACVAKVGETVVAEGEAMLLAPGKPKA